MPLRNDLWTFDYLQIILYSTSSSSLVLSRREKCQVCVSCVSACGLIVSVCIHICHTLYLKASTFSCQKKWFERSFVRAHMRWLFITANLTLFIYWMDTLPNTTHICWPTKTARVFLWFNVWVQSSKIAMIMFSWEEDKVANKYMSTWHDQNAAYWIDLAANHMIWRCGCVWVRNTCACACLALLYTHSHTTHSTVYVHVLTFSMRVCKVNDQNKSSTTLFRARNHVFNNFVILKLVWRQ